MDAFVVPHYGRTACASSRRIGDRRWNGGWVVSDPPSVWLPQGRVLSCCCHSNCGGADDLRPAESRPTSKTIRARTPRGLEYSNLTGDCLTFGGQYERTSRAVRQ